MEKIDLNGKTILVTGAAGFIGSNLVKRLLAEMSEGTIVGLDNMNDYYDVSLKEYRLKELEAGSDRNLSPVSCPVGFHFIKGDLADKALIDKLFAEYQFDVVVNLAAQAGGKVLDYQSRCLHPIEHDRILQYPRGVFWFMLLVVLCMAAIRKCRSRLMTGWTILCRSMLLRRRVMSCLRTATRNCIIFQQRDCDSSRCMDLREDLTWRTSGLRISCFAARPSKYSTMATVAETSRMWMTSWRVFIA